MSKLRAPAGRQAVREFFLDVAATLDIPFSPATIRSILDREYGNRFIRFEVVAAFARGSLQQQTVPQSSHAVVRTRAQLIGIVEARAAERFEFGFTPTSQPKCRLESRVRCARPPSSHELATGRRAVPRRGGSATGRTERRTTFTPPPETTKPNECTESCGDPSSLSGTFGLASTAIDIDSGAAQVPGTIIPIISKREFNFSSGSSNVVVVKTVDASAWTEGIIALRRTP